MSSALLSALSGMPNASELRPTLIIGGQPTADQLRAFGEAGGSLVLDIRDPMEPRPMEDERTLVESLGMRYENIPVSGGIDDGLLDRILAVIRSAGEEVLLFHCNSGNRCGAAVIAYCMLDLGMEEEAAVTEAMRGGLRSPEILQWGLGYVQTHASD